MSTLRLLVKPTIFTIGICGTCFCGAAIIQHENHKPHFGLSEHFSDLRKSRQARVFQDWTQRQQHIQQKNSISNQFFELRRKINSWKNSLTTGEKIAWGTIFVNAVILGAWRVRPLQPVMIKYFMSSVSKTKISLSPMILSCFSHSMPLHFAFNMYALYSFSNFATALLGPEQLIGLFISAGTVSSLASISFRLLTGRFSPSLGASGALLGVIAYVCIKSPDSRLLLFFIPIAAGNAIKGLMVIDTLGLLAKWSFMDHAAHLGGSLFGVWYATYGEKLFYEHRGTVVRNWLELKRQT